jgi:hypothetical protein
MEDRLKDVLNCAVNVDPKKSGKFLMDVFHERLKHTLEEGGAEKLYEEFPELRQIFKEA